MEKRIKCQICNRCFSNRKALGGHMKSHFVKAPLAAAAQPPPPPIHRYGFHQVTQQSRDLYSRHMQHSNRHSVSIDSDVFSDDTTRSSNCTASPPQQPPEAQSSVVSATSSSPEEDAARCLVMLSRGVWDEDHSAVGVLFSNYDDDCDGDYEVEQIEEDEETLAYYSSSDERESSFIKPPAKYKCETCNKEFKSYQALGGHRSSHSNSNNLANNHRIFKCSYCSRVFESGQALGGHKKVHSMFARNSIDDRGMIDLNNIPVEDDREFNDKFEYFISYDSLLH